MFEVGVSTSSSFVPTPSTQQSVNIPDWVKNNAASGGLMVKLMITHLHLELSL